MKIVLFIFIFFNFLYSAEIFKIDDNIYELDPKTLSLALKTKDEITKISYEDEIKDYKILDKNNTSIKLIRDNININFEFLNDHILIKTNANSNKLTFPIIKNSSEFIFPINSGKKIPADDKIFNSYLEKILDDTQISSVFSMNFFGIKNNNDYCLYIYKDRFYKNIDYKNKILKITQNFDTLSSYKSDEIIIYPHIDNITKIAKTYRNYKIKSNDFKYLKDKIKENQNVEKLLGAPQIYLASEIFFSIDDIKDGFIKAYKKEIENKKSILYTDEISSILKNMPNKLLQYQKIEIINSINESLYKKAFDDFFNSFKKAQDIKKEIISKLKPFIKNTENMGQGASLEILNNLKKLGIKNAWLCFHNFDMAKINPDL